MNGLLQNFSCLPKSAVINQIVQQIEVDPNILWFSPKDFIQILDQLMMICRIPVKELSIAAEADIVDIALFVGA